MFLLLLVHPGSLRQRAIKYLCVWYCYFSVMFALTDFPNLTLILSFCIFVSLSMTQDGGACEGLLSRRHSRSLVKFNQLSSGPKSIGHT